MNVAPHLPHAMCTATSSPSQLLYGDYRRLCSGKIHRVDCSIAPPTPQGEIPVVVDDQDDGHNFLLSMCTSHDLLVISRPFEGVFAYTLPGVELKWKVSGKLPGTQGEIHACGTTVDEQGHLFVIDLENICVHALSVEDGTHMGVVVRGREDVVGNPLEVIWHQNSASLVVAHEPVQGGVHLSVFSRQQ